MKYKILEMGMLLRILAAFAVGARLVRKMRHGGKSYGTFGKYFWPGFCGC